MSASGEVIEWFLYTNLEVNSLEDAIKVVQYYALQWVIEIYHKILKTGLKAENLQLETAHALFAAIPVMSIVGLRILDLRERLRMNPEYLEISPESLAKAKIDEIPLEIDARKIAC